MKLAKTHRRAHAEAYWHVYLAVVVAILLQFGLSNSLTVGPKHVVIGLELLLLLLLTLFTPRRRRLGRHFQRVTAIIFVAVISLANSSSLLLIIKTLFTSPNISGRQLLLSALAVYLTNIIIFGLWYWELDDTGGLGSKADIGGADFYSRK